MKLNLGSVLVSVSINPQHEHINNWNFKYPWIRTPAALEGLCSMGVPEALQPLPQHPGMETPIPASSSASPLTVSSSRIKQEKSNSSSGLEQVNWAAQGNICSSPEDQVSPGPNIFSFFPFFPFPSPFFRGKELVGNRKSLFLIFCKLPNLAHFI